MRHRIAGRRIGRNSSHKKANLRNLATSLIQHGRIRTTDAKAKELRSYVEKLVTMAKRDDLHSRRLVARKVFNRSAVVKLFADYGPRFMERPGGYTRIIKEGYRAGDAAPVSIIEFLGEDETLKTASPKKAKTEAAEEE